MANYHFQRSSNRSPLSTLFNEMRRDLASAHPPAAQQYNAAYQGTRGVYPPVNLTEDAEEYLLTAELPGVAPDAVDVTIEGSTVTISGQRKIDYAAGDGTAVHRRERQSGTFRRAFELPAEINLDAAKATHRNGVLTLALPKADAVKPRQIQIETS
ncbi:MAG: Hsp20/alpha crystallin family protein [Myxococcota bacterium]